MSCMGGTISCRLRLLAFLLHQTAQADGTLLCIHTDATLSRRDALYNVGFVVAVYLVTSLVVLTYLSEGTVARLAR
jgi:hypothetical protein